MSGNEGQDRRRILECMAWMGTGVLWTVAGGIPRSRLLGNEAAAAEASFSFVQISDSHLGFHGAANPDVAGTLRQAIAEVKEYAGQAAFMIHTGDVSHTSQPAQFDTAETIIREAGLATYFVPGEHDVLFDAGKGFFPDSERERRAGTASRRRACISSGSTMCPSSERKGSAVLAPISSPG